MYTIFYAWVIPIRPNTFYLIFIHEIALDLAIRLHSLIKPTNKHTTKALHSLGLQC